jgi:hypothetical protein
LNYKLSFITIWKSFFLSFALINLNLKFKFCRPFVMTKNQSFFFREGVFEGIVRFFGMKFGHLDYSVDTKKCYCRIL